MSLYDKIVALRPELKPEDFNSWEGTILLQDDSDGFGPYIAKWEHPTLARPTDEELGITRNPANVIIEGEIIADVPVIEAPVLEAPVIEDPQTGGA